MAVIPQSDATATLLALASPERRANAWEQPPRERFAPLWLRAGLIVATFASLALLYPRIYIEANLRQESRPSATTLAYLRLMVMAQPAATDTRLLLAQQALTAGDLLLSRYALEPWLDRGAATLPLNVALLRLRWLRSELDAAPPSSARHAELADDYVREVFVLAPRMRAPQLLRIARTVAALGQYRTAARLYRHIIARSSSGTMRLEAFHRGIEALLAAGRPADAFAFARAALPLLPSSSGLWRDMTRLALMADATHAAAGYARHLVGLEVP